MSALSRDELKDWVRLSRTSGIGPRTFQSLIARFGDAGSALAALPALARAKGRPISIPGVAEIETEFARAEAISARIIASCDTDFPVLLHEIDGPPPVITLRGDISALTRPMIGIVGARNAGTAGRVMAARLAEELSDAGLIVVSGLARGIDTEAHRASLHGGTIAVLAGGLEKPYPPENVPLIDRICEKGLIISEMPLGWVPRGQDFPRRNRLISGLSLGVVVVEAARRSGSLITARMAAEQGREVFAVPGSPLDARCEGSNDLLRNGATLVTCAADVLEVIRPMMERRETSFRENRDRQATYFDEWEADEDGLSSEIDDETADRNEQDLPLAQRVLNLMSIAPVEVDALQRDLKTSARELGTVLLELEMAGAIARQPGNRYAKAINR